jgi:TP901 family phage tail tape measure protein
MAAGSSVINVAILGDSKKFRKAVDKADSRLKKFSKAAAIGFAGVAVAGAKMAFDIGRSIETMENNIIAGTGASGAALDGLIDSARQVATEVPQSFDEVSRALADVNTNFGLTGAALQEQTELFLDFARVAGVDVAEAITIADSALTLFGENDADEALGDLLRVAQATGRPMEQLLASIEKFGPVFANMGFSLEETTALMGGLEQAGIDVTRISPGLNRFSREVAAVGGDPRQALEQTVAAIQQATTDVDALNIATQAFGAEGAQRLSAAIRAGVFDLQDFNGLLGDGTGLVDEQGDAMLTLGDRFDMLKNRLAVKLMPAIETLIEFLEDLFDAISEDGLSGAVDMIRERFDGFFDTVAQNKGIVASMLAIVVALGVAFLAVVAPVALAVAGFAALFAAAVFAYQELEIVRDTVETVIDAVGKIPTIFTKVKDALATIISEMFSPFGVAFSAAMTAISALWNSTIGGFGFSVPGWLPEIGGKDFRIPKMPAIDVPFMADGGIVTGPTLAMIGEAGSEAVIPLDRAGSFGGGDMTVNITMPAGSDGDDVVRALQSYQRRRGTLPVQSGTRRF